MYKRPSTRESTHGTLRIASADSIQSIKRDQAKTSEEPANPRPLVTTRNAIRRLESATTPAANTERLNSLFNPQKPKPILLLGAGASVKSGIPTSDELVERAARWAYCDHHGYHSDDPTIKRSDWLRWLTAHAWYNNDTSTAENYSATVEHLLQPRQARKDFFLRLINPGVPASNGYHELLKLIDEGFTDTVLTTNFDRVLLDLRAASNRPHHIDVIQTPADHTLISTAPQYPQYVFLHGTVEHYTDKNLTAEVQELDTQLVQQLTPLLRDRPIIVIGYRGTTTFQGRNGQALGAKTDLAH